jgi:hypothetical protein
MAGVLTATELMGPPRGFCAVQTLNSEERIKGAIEKAAVDQMASVERSVQSIERRMIAAERRADREASNMWWTQWERAQ